MPVGYINCELRKYGCVGAQMCCKHTCPDAGRNCAVNDVGLDAWERKCDMKYVGLDAWERRCDVKYVGLDACERRCGVTYVGLVRVAFPTRGYHFVSRPVFHEHLPHDCTLESGAQQVWGAIMTIIQIITIITIIQIIIIKTETIAGGIMIEERTITFCRKVIYHLLPKGMQLMLRTRFQD